MKKKHRWLKSAILASQHQDVFLPWVMRRAEKLDKLILTELRKTTAPPVSFPRAIAAR